MIGDFPRVRRELLAGLSEYAFGIAVEHGCIDSAVAFGILLTELGVVDEAGALRERSADEMCGALHRTIQRVVGAVAGREESLLNFVVCDGRRIVACRYATAPTLSLDGEGDEEMQPSGATLYLSAGSRWVASAEDRENYRMRKGADIACCTAIISSEPLTAVREEWLPIAPNSLVVCGYRPGRRQSVDVLTFPLDAGLPTLDTILGMETPAGCPAVAAPALRGEGLWMSVAGHVEDVNCLARLAEGRVVAAGSMDGSLRLFDVATGQTLATRRHSGASGPVLALLEASGPVARPCWASPGASPGASPSASPGASPGASCSASPVSSPGASPWHSEHPFGSELGASWSLPSTAPPSSESLEAAPVSRLLLSASNNELRVWDVSACDAPCPSQGGLDIQCLLCFRFAPNQGQLLSLAGSLHSVILGFQSTRVFRLRLQEGWDRLMQFKCRSQKTRHFTFNVDRSTEPPEKVADVAKERRGAAPAAPGQQRSPSRGLSAQKFRFHALLEAMEGHIGFVHCLASDPRTGLHASGGGDGQLIFWEGCEKRASFAHGAAILALAVSPTSSDFFSADDRGRIRIWDGAALERGSTASLVSGCAVLSLAVVEDTLLLAGDASGCIRVWDLQRSVLLREIGADMRCCAALSVLSSVAQPGGG